MFKVGDIITITDEVAKQHGCHRGLIAEVTEITDTKLFYKYHKHPEYGYIGQEYDTDLSVCRWSKLNKSNKDKLREGLLQEV